MSLYNLEIPASVSDPKEISKLLKINVDFLKKEISHHIDIELKRFAIELSAIKNDFANREI